MPSQASTFQPDWVSPPGDTIADLLEEREWSQTDLATRLGYSTKHVSLLINGKVSITDDTAVKLERVLGGDVAFWLAREAQYRAQAARVEAADRTSEWFEWLERLPVKELMAAGAISKRRIDAAKKPALVEDMLRFFGVASPEGWDKYYAGMQASYRRTRKEQSDVGAISAWLRLGEIKAERFDGPTYDEAAFEAALVKIRELTTLSSEEFAPRLVELCREAGVALVFVPAIPRAYVSGVARWLSPHRPLIQLSLYGKLNDRFWFTFFHEAAHILLHGKKAVFLDDFAANADESKEEVQANGWAARRLIPETLVPRLAGLTNKNAVRAFAQQAGVHPGIVVGRLQHEGIIEPSWMNDLKVPVA